MSVSIDGSKEVNDERRGEGVYDKIMTGMEKLKEYGILFGTSVCYTSQNVYSVTSDDFLDMLIEKGSRFIWYFHYMPVGNDAAIDLLPTPEQREYMYHRVREIRGLEGGKPIFAIDFQNDGEYVGGCIAGGRNYLHINPNGDVEPCVFIHYSSANIKEVTLLEALKQPLFMAYRDNQPFNNNHLRPCPMLENPEYLRASLESILVQTRTADEILLIEDGPLTQELYQVVAEYQKKCDYLHVHAMEQNVQLGRALAKGVELCQYDLIARMDTDDIAMPDRLEKEGAYMEAHPEVDVVGGAIREFNDEGTIDRVKNMPKTQEEILEYVKVRNPLNHMTVMYRKDSIL